MSFFFVLFILIFINCSLTNAQKIFIVTSSDNYGKINLKKSFYIGYANPSFGIIYDLKLPKKYYLITPDGKKEKITLFRHTFFDKALNIKRIGYKAVITPLYKGDYNICIIGDYSLTSQGKIIQDFTKVVFHVEEKKKWDNLCGFDLEIKPYTRPYGLKETAIFWGQVLYNGKPLKNGMVETEKLNYFSFSLNNLPRDSNNEVNYPLLKKETKISKNGFFVVSFEEPGWWVVSIKIKRGFKNFGNKLYPFEIRTNLWLYIFPKSL